MSSREPARAAPDAPADPAAGGTPASPEDRDPGPTATYPWSRGLWGRFLPERRADRDRDRDPPEAAPPAPGVDRRITRL